MKKQIFSLMTVLLLLLSLVSVPVFAQEALDPSFVGTITVTIPPDHGEVLGEVTLYRVADITFSAGAYQFVYNQDFAGMELPLDDLEDRDLTAALAEYVGQHPIEGETKVFEDNTVVFNASAGLYLVVHTGADGSGSTFVPFLVVFPGNQDDAFDYEISAAPKTGPAPTPTEPTEPVPEPTTPPPGPLPQTGQLNWPVPLLASAGMILFTVGWILRYRGREEDYEA